MDKTNSKETLGWDVFAKIQIIETEDSKELIVAGKPYLRWLKEDELVQRFAIVQLFELGLATQDEIAEIFHLHISSIYNYINAYKTDGIEGLIIQSSGPKQSWKMTPEVRGKILYIVLKDGIKRYEEIQERLKNFWNLKISIGSIRQVLIENGFVKENIISLIESSSTGLFEATDQMQLEINFAEGESKEVEINKTVKENGIAEKPDCGLEVDLKRKEISCYSRTQRIYLDQLEQGEYNVYGRGLLFAPFLWKYKFISTMKRIIKTETQEGYSIEELCQTLFYFAIFGFRSIENFKTVYSEEFGVLIGKMKSPSIYTLRRFLEKASELEVGEKLIEEFAKEYLKEGIAKWGIIYLDGHFMPYYGVFPVSMGWYTIRQKPFTGSYNFLGIDEKFNPYLFLVRSSEEDLLEKIPEMVMKAKEIGRQAGIQEDSLRNLIVVFDREGYSAKLFRKLDEMKIFHITWAKYFDKWVNEITTEDFKSEVEIRYEIQESEKMKYYETERNMNKYGKIRTIVIESGNDKKRAAIYTNHNEKKADEVIQIICGRWGEENLIKELLNKHMIDYSPGYQIEELLEQPKVEDPDIARLKKERGNLVSKINELKIEIADNILGAEKESENLEEIKKKEIELKGDIAILNHQVLKINSEIAKLPKDVKYDEAHGGEKLVKFNYERKRFLDCIKIFCYNMGKQMCLYLSKYYDKKKEIWPALFMIIRRGAYVKLEDGKLRVKLRRFKNSEINFAARHLCADLNEMKPMTLDKFCLPIYYEVE